jgi:hypothetical protein
VFSVREPDPDMPQDIDSPAIDPRYQVFDNPLLVPSSLLAAFPALEAVPVVGQSGSRGNEIRIG